jgi:hypothetical protein
MISFRFGRLEARMRGWLLTRQSFPFAFASTLAFAFALLSAVAASGCQKGSLGADMPAATGAGGSGESATCAAVMGADGSVCKQCIDATGAIVYDSCAATPPTPTGTAGTTGGGGTGPDGAAGAGGATGGSSGAACVKITDGGPTSCKDSATWKMYGAAACAQQNLTLTDISWDISCEPDRYQQVTYVCCGGCTTTVDATGQTCTTCTNAAGEIISSACSGGGVACKESTDANGNYCKTCYDPSGKVVSAECNNDAGSGATEICDVSKNLDGSPCKVCWEPDGSMISTCGQLD